MRSARRTLALAALSALALLGCGKIVGEGSKRLALETPKWWFQHLPVAVTARPAGALAGHEATLTVAVGSNVAGRWEMHGEATTLRVPARFFEVGSNQISVKTGTERSTANVQIISFLWLAMPLVLVVLILAYFVSWLLSRRRARSEAS